MNSVWCCCWTSGDISFKHDKINQQKQREQKCRTQSGCEPSATKNLDLIQDSLLQSSILYRDILYGCLIIYTIKYNSIDQCNAKHTTLHFVRSTFCYFRPLIYITFYDVVCCVQNVVFCFLPRRMQAILVSSTHLISLDCRHVVPRKLFNDLFHRNISTSK